MLPTNLINRPPMSEIVHRDLCNANSWEPAEPGSFAREHFDMRISEFYGHLMTIIACD